MGLIRYTSPKGLDREIDALQVRVYDALIAKGWIYYDSYPRSYVNSKNEKENTIEYAVNNKDYKEVLLNDKVNATSFFILTKSEKKDIRMEKASLSFVFQVNTKNLKPAVTTRIADEDIINEIKSILFMQTYSIKLLNVKKGVNDVYSDLKVNMSKRNELSEFCVCRFDMDLHYTLNEPTQATNIIN